MPGGLRGAPPPARRVGSPGPVPRDPTRPPGARFRQKTSQNVILLTFLPSHHVMRITSLEALDAIEWSRYDDGLLNVPLYLAHRAADLMAQALRRP